jgi:hypothetical protein
VCPCLCCWGGLQGICLAVVAFFLPPLAVRANSQRLQRHLARHPMEPAVQAALLSEASGLPGQNQKRRLRRILGITGIAQHPKTGPIDHRTVVRNQLRKGSVVALHRVALDKFPVGFDLHVMTSIPEHTLPSTPMLTINLKRFGVMLKNSFLDPTRHVQDAANDI